MCNTLVRNLEEKPRGWRASAEKVVILMFARSDTKVTTTELGPYLEVHSPEHTWIRVDSMPDQNPETQAPSLSLQQFTALSKLCSLVSFLPALNHATIMKSNAGERTWTQFLQGW